MFTKRKTPSSFSSVFVSIVGKKGEKEERREKGKTVMQHQCVFIAQAACFASKKKREFHATCGDGHASRAWRENIVGLTPAPKQNNSSKDCIE